MDKKKILLISFLFLFGLCVLIYPVLSNAVNRIHGSYAIETFRQELDQVDTEQLLQQRVMAENYNKDLLEKSEGEGYAEILNFANGMMGQIQIPKLNIHLPIYHGVDEEVLAKGIGHMPQTAFPIGGEGNHTVLTGHTGLPTAKLFTDLTELVLDDVFYIEILGEILAYQIDQIRVVLPNDGQELIPVAGKDYCTLVTCTPYGVNSHRLLVRGVRMEMEKNQAQEQLQQELEANRSHIWIWLAAGIVTLFGVLIVLCRRRIL